VLGSGEKSEIGRERRKKVSLSQSGSRRTAFSLVVEATKRQGKKMYEQETVLLHRRSSSDPVDRKERATLGEVVLRRMRREKKRERLSSQGACEQPKNCTK